MNFTVTSPAEYQQLAARTFKNLPTREDDYLHLELGVYTELGELLDIFKRKIAYGKEIDRVHLVEEWADVAWYLALFDQQIIEVRLPETDFSAYATTAQAELTPQQQARLVLGYQKGWESRFQHSYSESWFRMGYVLGIDVPTALALNIKKLWVRYPEKFSNENALIRNLVAERQALDAYLANLTPAQHDAVETELIDTLNHYIQIEQEIEREGPQSVPDQLNTDPTEGSILRDMLAGLDGVSFASYDD